MANGKLITNANAPVVKLTITIDNRYNPAEIQMQSSHPMPASVTVAHLLACAMNVQGMIIAAEAQAAAGNPPVKPPDLPPVPPS